MVAQGPGEEKGIVALLTGSVWSARAGRRPVRRGPWVFAGAPPDPGVLVRARGRLRPVAVARRLAVLLVRPRRRRGSGRGTRRRRIRRIRGVGGVVRVLRVPGRRCVVDGELARRFRLVLGISFRIGPIGVGHLPPSRISSRSLLTMPPAAVVIHPGLSARPPSLITVTPGTAERSGLSRRRTPRPPTQPAQGLGSVSYVSAAC